MLSLSLLFVSWMRTASSRKLHMQTFQEKLGNIIPTGTFLTQADNVKPSIETAWLNVNVSKHEQEWSFNELLGFEPHKLLCLHRWKIWWMIPKIIHDYKAIEGAIPAETTLILGKLLDGSYLAILPSVDNNMVFSFEGSLSFHSAGIVNNIKPVLILHGSDNSHDFKERQTDLVGQSYKAALFVKGSNPFRVTQHAVNLLKQHMRQSVSDIPSFPSKSAAGPAVIRGPGPSFVDYFGWCTWDSFYTDLSSKRLLHGLDSFTNIGVTPRFLILDDGWQSTNVDDKMNGEQWTGRLKSFHANFKFHSDFKHPLDGNIEEELEITQDSDTEETEIMKPNNPSVNSGCATGDVQLCLNETASLEQIIKLVKSEHGIKYFLVWQ